MRTFSPFDLVGGLPMHPLVVHAAVAFLPLGMIGLIIIVFSARARARWRTPVVLVLAFAGLATLAARESGEALEHRVGEPGVHAEYAEILTVVAGITVAGAILWWFLEHRATRAVRSTDGSGETGASVASAAAAPSRSVLSRVLGWVLAALAAASLVLVVMVGHSGATATWEDQVAGTTPTSGESEEGGE